MESLQEKIGSQPYLTAGYSEFFADIVAVLDSGSGDAVSRALEFSNLTPLEREMAEARNFLRNVAAKGWTDVEAHIERVRRLTHRTCGKSVEQVVE